MTLALWLIPIVAFGLAAWLIWRKGRAPREWSRDATERARHQIRIAGRGSKGIVHVSRWL